MATLASVQRESVLPPYKLYSTFYDNDIKDVQELCIVSAGPKCTSGVAANLDLVSLLEGNRPVELEDTLDMIQDYAKNNAGKGFLVWSDIAQEVGEVREFIGDARVVTGFHYDGSLPETFEKYNIENLDKKIFSVKDWFETFLEKSMSLSQTIQYFGFWIDLDINRELVRTTAPHERAILVDHKENLFLSVYLAIVAHMMVNNKLLFD